MVSNVADQFGVSQNFARLRVHVNLPHLSQTPSGCKRQDHRNTSTQPVVVNHQCGIIASQTCADLVQQKYVDLAPGRDWVTLSVVETWTEISTCAALIWGKA